MSTQEFTTSGLFDTQGELYEYEAKVDELRRERRRMIIGLRAEGMTLEDLARITGTTKQRIHQILGEKA